MNSGINIINFATKNAGTLKLSLTLNKIINNKIKKNKRTSFYY